MSDSTNQGGSEPDSSVGRTRHAYWRANLKVMAILLSIWFIVSYGLGILFVDVLNRFQIGGFPVGFWVAQQGSIYVFVALIFVYARWMDRIHARFEVD